VKSQISHCPLGKCYFISYTYLWYIFATIPQFGLPRKRILLNTSSMPSLPHPRDRETSRLAAAIIVPLPLSGRIKCTTSKYCMTSNKITFSQGKMGILCHLYLLCGPFLHRIPTIQRRTEGTYLSIEMNQ
jgi:hypothetical protein